MLCPCWIGEDPDNGSCETALAYVIRAGGIDGVDVGGLVVAVSARIPGNILDGGFGKRFYVDARADDAQAEALADLMSGRRGGPFEDMAGWSARPSASSGPRSTTRLPKGRGGSASAGWSRRR